MGTRFLIWLLLPLIAACAAIPSAFDRRANADSLAATNGWHAQRLPAGPFDLVVYGPSQVGRTHTLTVYIEGDGFAWLNPSTPSADPTPRDPIALKLALAHPAGDAVYLARPCQYIDAGNSDCRKDYWTHRRFAPEVIAATDVAIDALKMKTGAAHLILVGYSGGGAIAALVAARRQDVLRLVTVAGNLDHVAWTMHHRVGQLSGSLNAVDVAERLAGVPQVHFIGSDDRTIPPELARRWPTALTGPQGANLHIVDGFDHACCWAANWGQLFARGGR